MNKTMSMFASKKDFDVAKVKELFTSNELDNLSCSDAYAEYIMAKGDRPCCNGNMLVGLMEDGYLFDEFLVAKFG